MVVLKLSRGNDSHDRVAAVMAMRDSFSRLTTGWFSPCILSQGSPIDQEEVQLFPNYFGTMFPDGC